MTYQPGTVDYNVSWGLLWIFGLFGIHRFYQGKIISGLVYALTGGLFTIGFAYDVLTLNEQIHEQNIKRQSEYAYY